MSAPVYLDHNASSPMRPQVVDAMTEVMHQAGNASSVHAFGRRHRQYVENARAEVAALAGVQADNVVFTSGGTEANNLALGAFARNPVLVSAVEHDSVLKADEDATRLPVDSDGVVDLTLLKRALPPNGALVSVMLANNETGVVQPVAEIVSITAAAGAIVHTDAVQAAGRIELDVPSLGVAMASLSAHKLGGPQGVGALILSTDIPVAAQMLGGGQERGRRAGTENTAGIVGFGVAARLARQNLTKMRAVADLRDMMEIQLRQAIPETVVFGGRVERLPNTSCFAVPGLRSEIQIMALDIAGLAVSAGSACSSGKVSSSHVLRAMGIAESLGDCAIRVSFGPENTRDDAMRLIAVLSALKDRRGRRPADAA